MLQRKVLVRLGLMLLVIDTPSDLEHEFKCPDRLPVLFHLLEHLAHFIVDHHGFSVIIRVLGQVAQKVKDCHGFLRHLKLLEEQHEQMRVLG